MLAGLGVRFLVLPAVESVCDMWCTNFGFVPLRCAWSGVSVTALTRGPSQALDELEPWCGAPRRSSARQHRDPWVTEKAASEHTP